MKPKIFVVDASGYLYRSYFAIRNITNHKGLSTNALFGFIRSIAKLIKDFNPDYLVSVFDGPHNAKSREAIYSDYKAHRASMPPDLLYQIEWARHYCDLNGIPSLSIPEVEADDTMGSIGVWAREFNAEAFLCTSDKDLCQLVNGSIFILNTFKENQILGAKEVEENFGVPPEKMVDYLSITGDSSDNVPGISGFGPKTAVDLIKKYGSLDHILNNPGFLTGKKRDTLIQERDRALMSRELVTINTKVKVPYELDFYRLKGKKIDELKEFFAEMNFNTLLKELEVGVQENNELKKTDEKTDYKLVNDEKSFQALLTVLQKTDEICFDTETTHLEPLRAKLIGLSFCLTEGEAWYVPLNGALERRSVLQRLKNLFENPEKKFYGHNVKYDVHMLLSEGINVSNISFDTMLASYLLNAHERRHNLDYLTLSIYGKVITLPEDLIGKGKKQISMEEVPLEQISSYACQDVDYTFRLKQKFELQLKERNLENLFTQVELPLVNVLIAIERKGMWLDIPFLHTFQLEVQKELNLLTEEIYRLAGEPFNLNSPKQVQGILFEKMKIRPPRKTATGNSTDAEVLEELKWEHPIAEKLLEYRTLEKLRTTYIEKLPTQVHENDGRIHCTLNQTVAATGRLSSQDPNLQNIPIRTPLGRKIREAFKPQKPGWSYLSGDYSQIELRLLTHFSEDPILIEAFSTLQDVHTHTASVIFGLKIDEVLPEMRQRAKAVNFGILYGQGEFGLSRTLGISRFEAGEIISLYFKRYKRVYEYIQEQKEVARKSGRSTTLTGRERLIPEITSKNAQIRMAAERLAVNSPLQGTNADLIKMAMIKIHEEILSEKKQGYMILQIHDELLFEIPDEEIPYFSERVSYHMQNIIKLNVPLVVDIHVGKNWKEC